MTVSGLLPVLLVGAFGGLLGEILKWYQLRESPNVSEYARRPMYWIATAAIALSRGVEGQHPRVF